MKKKLVLMGMFSLVLAFGMIVIGCASAPPPAFEIAGSLEETAWIQSTTTPQMRERSILVMSDKTSGVFTDRENKETAFTYAAAFDAEKKNFTGTLSLEDGKTVEFSAQKGLFGWKLSAKKLDEYDFNYITPETLKAEYAERSIKIKIEEKYGSEYLGLNEYLHDGNGILRRDSDNFSITYDTLYGLHEKKEGTLINLVLEAYRLHSKDGIAIELLSINTNNHRYDNAETAGSFNIRISGETVTISNGTGAGTKFNGTYKKDS